MDYKKFINNFKEGDVVFVKKFIHEGEYKPGLYKLRKHWGCRDGETLINSNYTKTWVAFKTLDGQNVSTAAYIEQVIPSTSAGQVLYGCK